MLVCYLAYCNIYIFFLNFHNSKKRENFIKCTCNSKSERESERERERENRRKTACCSMYHILQYSAVCRVCSSRSLSNISSIVKKK